MQVVRPPAAASASTTKIISRAPGAQPAASPDLRYFRERYPLTVAGFGTLADREAWLRRVWELDVRWQDGVAARESAAAEVVVRGAPPASARVEAEFDIIYAGGVLGLLHAGVMACRHRRRVLVFDAHAVGRAQRGWNVSDEELREFERAGLFTKEELERAVVNRYRAGFVKFHDAASRIKAEPLWVRGVLDVAVEADALLALCAEKIRARGPENCALADGLRFVRAYVEPHRVTVETRDARSGASGFFAARLFVDSTGPGSAVARQLDGGRAPTHVCPVVGTVASGFARGEGEPDKVDFGVGEILVSTEDASEHRQLIWEGFAGSPRRDEYATYLFFYDAVDSPADKSLLALFERYFATLPAYKRRGAQWRVRKPVFGHAPGFQRRGWNNRRRTAEDRVLTVGEAAGLFSPLTFGGFGPHVRNLRRLTRLTELALAGDHLDAAALSEVNDCGPRAAQMAPLAEFMRPARKAAPSAVNETLNAVMAALHGLDEGVRRELFQDRMTFGALRSLLGATARLYPRIFQRLREHLGARGTAWWLADIAAAFAQERLAREARENLVAPDNVAADADASTPDAPRPDSREK